MKKYIKLFLAALVCLAFNQTTVFASSHREAPLISNDPLADNTDLYAFRSPCDPTKIVFIANYIPFEHPAGGPNWYTFGDNIRYEIRIKNQATASDANIIYRFTFSSQNEDPSTFFNIRLGKQNLKTTYKLERSLNEGKSFTTIVTDGVVPPANIGPRSIENAVVGLGASSYNSLATSAIKTATTGEKVFCGPIDDPFFVDLGGAFDVGGFRKKGRDGLFHFNCHTIALQVNISTLQKDHKTVDQATSILDPNYIIGVYASASRRKVTTLDTTRAGTEGTGSGDWVQVSRLGMPLTNEVVIPVGKKDKWNATHPTNDLQFAEYFKNPELALYMDDSQFGGAVPGLASLRIQTNSLGAFDFRNGKKGLWPLKGSPAVAGTALDDAAFGNILLPDSMSPRAVDLLPIFYTGVPNLAPYQLATGKGGNPLAAGKPFINNFLPTLGDLLRLNMAVPPTPRNSADFSSLGIVSAAVLGLTDARFNGSTALQNIPNMDGFPNGRRLEDDVTTIELQAVSGVALAAIGLWYDDYNGTGSPVTTDLVNVLSFNAGVTKNDTTFKPCFPFVQDPWRGFTGSSYQGTLPLTWAYFTAAKEAKQVNLNWQIANGMNNDRYETERSFDGTSFTKIGTVKADNNRVDYSAVDLAPAYDKINYYRIKEIDKDGKFFYSAIRKVVFADDNVIGISPNPAHNILQINAGNRNNLQVSIFDFAGRKVNTTRLNGNGVINISSLAKGLYTVTVESNGTKIATSKVVVQ